MKENESKLIQYLSSLKLEEIQKKFNFLYECSKVINEKRGNEK